MEKTEKQTKNPITREWVGKELAGQNRADLRVGVTASVLYTAVFLPISVLISYCGIYRQLAVLPARIVLTVLSAVLFSSPAWLSLIALGRALWERRQLRNGNFAILFAEVAYKTERAARHHIREVLGFDGFSEKQVEHTLYLLSEKGDGFYLVRYGKSRRIRLLYPAKLYERRDA